MHQCFYLSETHSFVKFILAFFLLSLVPKLDPPLLQTVLQGTSGAVNQHNTEQAQC